jgi:hypothetical protein
MSRDPFHAFHDMAEIQLGFFEKLENPFLRVQAPVIVDIMAMPTSVCGCLSLIQSGLRMAYNCPCGQ